MPNTRNLVALGGRILAGGFFLQNGLNHYKNTEMMTAYAKSKGVPAPKAAVLATGTLLVAGGTSILTGYRPKLGITAISAFFVGVSPKMHGFWKIDDEKEKMNEMVNFTKNMGFLGAVLALRAIPEPWPLSPGSAVAVVKEKRIARREEAMVQAGHS